MDPTFLERYRDLAADDRSGATDVTLGASDLLLDAIDDDCWRELLEPLTTLRPIMAPLLGLVRAVQAAADADEARARLLHFRETLRLAPAQAGRVAADWIGGLRGAPSRVLTVSASVAVEHALLALHEAGRLKGVTFGESRPAGEGRAMAARLADRLPDVRVTWDAALPGLLRPDCVAMFGADAVTGGAVYNKVGSLMLAQVATSWDIPVFAVTTTHKIVPVEMQRLFAAAERDLVARAEARARQPGDPLYDLQFEPVPRDLLTAVITEEGPLPGPVRAPGLGRGNTSGTIAP